MRLQFEATPQELESKGDALIKALIDEFHEVDHDLAERLEKALPPKEPVLKYPVLRALHKKTAQAYDAMLGSMLGEIGKVLDQSVAGTMKKALEPEDELEKAKYTKRTINPNPPPKYLYEYGKPETEAKPEPQSEPEHSKAVAKLEGKIVATEHGNRFETGKSVTFTFSRNLDAAPKPKRGMEDRFQQRIEPAGRYMIHVSKGTPALPNGIVDEITFNKPIVIKENTGDSGGIYDEHSWKMNLSKAYGGKKGKALAAAIAKDGYDGIVTVGKHGTGEIVDLRYLHTGVIEKGMLEDNELEKAMAEAADELAEPVYDHTQPLAEKDGRAYNRVKAVLKKRGYKDTDFERGGKLFGMSTNELIDLARDNNATDG